MNVSGPINALLEQLHAVISELSQEQYTAPISVLSQATIGQHTRHILEFFIELEMGYQSGVIDYDQRERSKRIENDKSFGLATLLSIAEGLDKADKALVLQIKQAGGQLLIKTNYFRELIYNQEHAVHHMAFIRIGISPIAAVIIPEGFGVAASTMNYRKACAR
jgi:hypothetical protein